MNDFEPYKKGQYIYMIEFEILHDSVVIDIRREEIISTFKAKQTRHFCIGKIQTQTCYGDEHEVDIINAYHNLIDALNCMTHVISESVMIYTMKEINAFIKECPIGSFRFCVECGMDTGETPRRRDK